MHTFAEIANDARSGSEFDRLIGDCFCRDEFSLQTTAMFSAAAREDYQAMITIARSQVERMREEYESRTRR